MKPVRVLAVFLVLLCGALGRAAKFETKSFQTAVALQSDGTAIFVETIEVRFLEPQHGIVRKIPISTKGNGGVLRQVAIDDISAECSSDPSSGSNYPVHVSRDGDLNIKIGRGDSLVSGAVTYRIHYTVRGAITDISDSSVGAHTEFYWNVIPAHWATSIESATIAVAFPPTPDALKAKLFVGLPNSKDALTVDTQAKVARNENAEISFNPDGKFFGSTRPLRLGEGATLVLAFPTGLIQANPVYVNQDSGTRPELVIGKNSAAIASGIVFVMAGLGLFFMRKRMPWNRPAIPVSFEPPKDFGVIESGALLDGKITSRTVLGSVISLAQNKRLLLAMDPESRELAITFPEYLAKQHSRYPISECDKELLTELTEHGPVFNPSVEGRQFGTALYSVQTRSLQKLKNGGFLTSTLMAPGCMKLLFALIAGIICFVKIAEWTDVVIGAGALFGFFVVGLISLFCDSYTEKGRLARAQLLGLKEFITRSYQRELNYFAKTDFNQALYDRLLPYAVMFNAVKEWSQAFEGIELNDPDWFVGYDSGSLWYWQLDSMMNTYDSSFTPNMPTRSSSSYDSGSDWSSGGSGFDSGGGSDSGGGGGGGDSW